MRPKPEAANDYWVRRFYMGRRIEGLAKYQRKRQNGYFGDLPPHLRSVAAKWLKHFVLRWGNNLPQWRFAILVGQAKRLALHPPSSSWGRSMHAKRGGFAVQRRYRAEGRNPTQKATRVRLFQQKAEKARRERTRALQERKRRQLPTCPWDFPPEAVVKANQWIILADRPNLRPPPSPEARALHKQLDLPGCRCYYCAWPNHDEP
jgi:hypothetical protein